MNQIQQQQKDYGTDVIVDGRIVWGNLEVKNKKNFQTKQDELDPKTGKPITEVVFGLAIPKPNPQSTPEYQQNFANIWNAIHTEAYKQGYQYPNPKFAWKFVDGDTAKDGGGEYPKEYKGCIVITCGTRIPVQIFKAVVQADGSQVHQQLTPKDVKAGDYVRVNVSVKGHPAPNPGLFINPNGVLFLAAGEAIISGASPNQLFGSNPFAVPQEVMQQQAQGGMQIPNFGGAPQMGNSQQVQQPMQNPQFGGQQQFQQPMNQQVQGAPMQGGGMPMPNFGGQTQQQAQPYNNMLPAHLQNQQQQQVQQPMQNAGPQQFTIPQGY